MGTLAVYDQHVDTFTITYPGGVWVDENAASMRGWPASHLRWGFVPAAQVSAWTAANCTAALVGQLARGNTAHPVSPPC